MSAPWRAAAQAGLLVAAAALIGAAETPAPASAAAFAPPLERPMLLSRTVVRELEGGAAIVATRRYRIVFRRTEAGWRVEGDLVASEIDAPAALSALAAIERERPDDGLFPILLDAAGRIVPRSAPAGQGRAAVEQALKVAPGLRGEGSPPDPAFLERIARAASAGGAVTRWPDTLFLPSNGRSEVAEAIALPGGGDGLVRVSLDQAAAADAAVMARVERTVTTELAGVRRVAREAWTLEPAPAVVASR